MIHRPFKKPARLKANNEKNQRLTYDGISLNAGFHKRL
jgi:hypothetical protein